MKRIFIHDFLMVIGFMAIWGYAPDSKAIAMDPLRYRCSHQIFIAFENENLQGFSRETGIIMNVRHYPSDVSVNLLVNGYCDIASTAQLKDFHVEHKGYKLTAVCNDPLAIVANIRCGIDNVTDEQLTAIFSGEVKNWKELGGTDLPITIIVPAKNTCAMKNFKRQVMKHKEIVFSIWTATTDLALNAVNHLPMGSISFTLQGADLHQSEIKVLTVNGISTKDGDYPYMETIYYVTKGEPSGEIKDFIDFTLSEKGSQIIKKNGMIPIGH